jgi:hypothetical protein
MTLRLPTDESERPQPTVITPVLDPSIRVRAHADISADGAKQRVEDAP